MQITLKIEETKRSQDVFYSLPSFLSVLYLNHRKGNRILVFTSFSLKGKKWCRSKKSSILILITITAKNVCFLGLVILTSFSCNLSAWLFFQALDRERSEKGSVPQPRTKWQWKRERGWGGWSVFFLSLLKK